MPESIEVQPLGHGRYAVVRDDQRRLAFAVVRGRQTWIFLDGRVFVVDDDAGVGERRTSVSSEQSALASPMPATVISVGVVAGQTVARGDVLMMLEAMKMELPIKAPRDGIVKAVACQAGELVQPGVPLVELE